ncbi:MAG: hypothetical protein QM702_03045 [Rubrivivax sp.]
MRTLPHPLALLCAATLGSVCTLPPARAQALPEPGAGAAPGVRLDDAELDRIRGGFMTGDGLAIAFGIESAVYVNGVLKTTTTLQLPAGSPAVASVLPGMTLVQNGPGNSYVSNGGISVPLGGTVVQNTLDNQAIQHITTINATVNSAQILKAQNLESALRGALIDSLRR